MDLHDGDDNNRDNTDGDSDGGRGNGGGGVFTCGHGQKYWQWMPLYFV